jgi:hypothetical protein
MRILVAMGLAVAVSMTPEAQSQQFPRRLEDFAGLVLPKDDIADLKQCRVGSCEIKLSARSGPQGSRLVEADGQG